MAELPDVQAQVVYRPFLLDPTIPPEGLDFRTYMAAKFGPDKLKTLNDPLIAAGQADGIAFAFDQITRAPSSLDAHRLLRWAHVIGTQATVKEALFTAYFCSGQDIGNSDVLKTIAIVNGFNGDQIRALLASTEDKAAVHQEAQRYQQMGVTGVPTFVFNQKHIMVGAQPVAELTKLIRKLAAEA